jgi:hypothetical protein
VGFVVNNVKMGHIVSEYIRFSVISDTIPDVPNASIILSFTLYSLNPDSVVK